MPMFRFAFIMALVAYGMKGNPTRMIENKLAADEVLVSHASHVPKVEMVEGDQGNSFRDEHESELVQGKVEQEGESVALSESSHPTTTLAPPTTVAPPVEVLEQSLLQTTQVAADTKGQKKDHAQAEHKVHKSEALDEIAVQEQIHISMANRSHEHKEPISSAGKPVSQLSLAEVGSSFVQTVKNAVNKFASAVEMKRAPNSTAADSVEVPAYFFNIPAHIKFTGASGDTATVTLLDRFSTFQVPWYMMYVFPIVFFVLYSLLWCVCCMRSNRTELSFRLVCEAATCFMCLWADLATKHKVITGTRAWSYVLVMALLLIGWNIASMKAKGTDYENTVFYVFQPLVILVWLIFAVERTFVRKFYRRSVNPMASDHSCSDCAVHVCCAQFSALQEAQFMSTVNVNEMKRTEQRLLASSQKW